MGLELFLTLSWVWGGVAVVVFVALFFVSAPYGRHGRQGWGPTIPARAGWLLMELPAPLLVLAGLTAGGRALDGWSLLLGGMFLAHYANRAVIFPMRMPPSARPMPISIVASALGFNLVNGTLQGLWLGHFAPAAPDGWWHSPHLVAGLVLFVGGAALNLHSDAVLRALRRPGETGYRVPERGAHRLVAAPNYLGEIIEWTGFTLACWSVPALVFLVWTLANLVPRAYMHRRWYRETFPGYPRTRRALIPFVW